MNTSGLNIEYTLQECSRNTNTSDVTISKSADKKETVNYSLNYDVFKSKDTSGCQTHSKALHTPENDSEVFAPLSERIKNVQSLTITEPDILKQANVNAPYDSRVYGGTSSQEFDATNDSQVDDDTDYGHKDSCNKKDKADLFHGTNETQVSEGGEADLHKHHVGCKKNPGHTKFVPVNDFNTSHLPEGHHDNDLVEYIKATADLTVRVPVKFTSMERLEYWPNTTVPYGFYNMRGSDVMRVGTGFLCDVYKWTEEDIKGLCQCHKCQHSDTPSKVWGHVRMETAAHVVFDDLEARHTTCRLFFDRQDSPLVTLDGWTMGEAVIKEDWCWLTCVTCDVDLLDKLDKMRRHWIDLWDKVINKYKSSRDKDKLTFIVSHPHGCPKQISVGHWINRSMERGDDGVKNYDITMYTYTTCTCPGSSGAYVNQLGYHDGCDYVHHVHSGVNCKGNNFSGSGREWT